ncbi:MAG: hypothetical protein J0649_05870, partial [Methylococcales bacterium]|nr:hypothetical protein [Methylococcales bacterium]
MSNREPVEIDGLTGEVEELPPRRGKRYRCELSTAQDVRREMAKVYRECRSNMMDAQTGTKLVWMLQGVAKVIETSDLEKR